MCHAESEIKWIQRKGWCSYSKTLKRSPLLEITSPNQEEGLTWSGSKSLALLAERWKWKTEINGYEFWRHWENEGRKQVNENRIAKA